MAQSVVEGDLLVRGALVAQSLPIPANAVTDASIQAGAGVQYTKVQQQRSKVLALSDHTVDAAVTRKVIHRVRGATGTLLKFGVGATQAAGASSSATVDLKKNGSTVLTATITLDNTTSGYTLKEAAGFTSAALVTGDVLEVDVTAVSGANKPKGLFAFLETKEDPA